MILQALSCTFRNIMSCHQNERKLLTNLSDIKFLCYEIYKNVMSGFKKEMSCLCKMMLDLGAFSSHYMTSIHS